MRQRRTGTPERTTSVEEATRLILESVSRAPAELVPLAAAGGRVLAEPITAAEDLWPFPRAAMDGVAVQAADVATASPAAPVALRMVGAAYSGDVWPVPLEPGTALRIATGTPVPAGADAVIPLELLDWRGDEAIVTSPVVPGRHVFPSGDDARAGDVVLTPGVTLHGGQMGLLAALGRDLVPVVRRLAVALLATGDELVPPSASLRPGQVRESNTYALAAEIGALGALPRVLGAAPDQRAHLEARIREGLAADALIICGGASVGDRDLVREVLARVGVAIKFAGVAMKPGAPIAFGVYDTRPVFALPGTPGAARMAFEVLVRPALCTMMGHRSLQRPVVPGRLECALEVTPGRRRFLWAHAVLTAAGVRVRPLQQQGTATIRSAAEANALIDVPPDRAFFPEGTLVPVHALVEGEIATVPHPGRPAFGVVGAKGAGKTTLIERLVVALRPSGLEVGVVKHHAHQADPDAPGTDTARYAAAGAAETVLAGPGAIVHRTTDTADPPLDRVLGALGPVDLILVEGYSGSSLPKILVERKGAVNDRPSPGAAVVAVVGDAQDQAAAETDGIPRFGWDQVDALAAFIEGRISGARASARGPRESPVRREAAG